MGDLTPWFEIEAIYSYGTTIGTNAGIIKVLGEISRVNTGRVEESLGFLLRNTD